MRTAYCPKSHGKLAEASAGVAFGHVPGHQYRDVDVVVSVSATMAIRVHVCESWGSCQGHDEEHGRREVVGRGQSVQEACNTAMSRAIAAGIGREYLTQALSQAEDAATEEMEDRYRRLESDVAKS